MAHSTRNLMTSCPEAGRRCAPDRHELSDHRNQGDGVSRTLTPRSDRLTRLAAVVIS